MGGETFQRAEVWRKAHAFVLEAYRMTGCFPREEAYGLTSQLRRAAVSVPANIAEGYRRRTVADRLRFYNIAQGSLEECRYYFDPSQRSGLLRLVRTGGEAGRSGSGCWPPASGSFTPPGPEPFALNATGLALPAVPSVYCLLSTDY